ncbi:hypothetical protein JI435_403340 [Parastagonospora nodorum SN15]|uniref:Uncharacterized protein n=1 Tax=Phaeosphaeria nodorum (strain SN15 / ATCC MYA-4574 / FGSC 10173) TaxID=321614 RepID=A0A7U2HYT8_PHANO|nr:hypothetical protein JI435_403340 [Parastagonospora nodorum SN15]
MGVSTISPLFPALFLPSFFLIKGGIIGYCVPLCNGIGILSFFLKGAENH